MITQPARSRRMAALACLLLLVAAAIFLRWDEHPRTYFADELIPLAVVEHMRSSGTLDTNWDHADWGGDYAGGFYDLHQYNFSSYHTFLLAMRTLAHAMGADTVPDLVLYRGLSLLCQLVALWLVTLAAHRLGGLGAGVLAAAFFALMPPAVIDAHYARPESFVMMLVALGCWLALQAGHPRVLLLEGVVWGVAFACKFSFLPMVGLAFLHRAWQRRQWSTLVLWGTGLCAGVAVSAPYLLLDPTGFLHGIGLLLNQYSPAGQPVDDAGWLPSAHQLFPYLAVFVGAPVLLVVCICSGARAVPWRCLAGWALPLSLAYVVVFARQGVFFERNLSHLLPLWALLFAGGIITCTQGLSRWRQPTAAWLAALCLAWPAWLSCRVAVDIFGEQPQAAVALARYEQALMAAHPDAALVTPNIMLIVQEARELGSDAILRVPLHKLQGIDAVLSTLANDGFREVGRVAMPLAFLPYNQLQINHVAPAYGYYRRLPSTAETP